MYTLEQLQGKSLAELKEIGSQLNVLPAADRRFRQSWIEGIAGINPPLLQLLEVSPAASVEPVQQPIMETVETSPGVEVDPVSEPPIESKFGRIVYPKQAAKPIAQNEKARPQLDRAQSADVHNLGSHPTKSDRDSSGAKTEALGSKEGDRVLAVARHCETGRGRVLPDQSTKLVNLTGVEVDLVQEPIVQAAEKVPGVEVDRVQDMLPECVECFGDGYFEDGSGYIKCFSRCSTQPKISQSAIGLAAKNHIKEESDLNPILTGITLSDRFLARYSPPQSETLHYELTDGYKVDTDGQLSLFEAQVVTEPEPPDPDDFESIDAFREAIALWDAQNPEPPAVSIDSMCEWAPCPEKWYEPKAEILPLKASSMIELPEQSEVMEVSELSPARKSSITSDFFILTFGCWGDRFNGSDEPPDTWIFARLPKPKPPTFPPQSSQPQLNHASRNYPETIPKLFHRVAAGSSTQPARSPPGGDVCF
jgi:hypothetical protein